MSFIIDQNICVGCGSCIGNCPNRAIIRKDNVVFVTEMCSDCGTCLYYCPMEAIGKGKTAVEYDNKTLDKALKEKLSLKRNIVAMKFADKAPDGIIVEEGPHFWCGICGDILDGNGTPVFFYCKGKQLRRDCKFRSRAKKATKEEFETVVKGQVIGEGNLYATKEIMSKGRSIFPKFAKVRGGVILGSLEKISRPDLILFPVNGHQMCIISTAYAFDTGELIFGYAGKSACLMSVPFPYIENRPVFTNGDHGGRTFMRLKDEEFIVCFPYRLIPGLVKNMDRTVFAKE